MVRKNFNTTDVGGDEPFGGLGLEPPFDFWIIPAGADVSPEFRPRFSPDRFRIRKERTLDRSENFCSGENVSDGGSKAREIHISGKIRDSEIDVFQSVEDYGDKMTMRCAAGIYDIYVGEGEIDGPTGHDPRSGEKLWDFSLDVVVNAENVRSEDGVIDDGTPTIEEIGTGFRELSAVEDDGDS